MANIDIPDGKAIVLVDRATGRLPEKTMATIRAELPEGDTEAIEAKVTEFLSEHVNATTPHPAYDEPARPSLALIYANALI